MRGGVKVQATTTLTAAADAYLFTILGWANYFKLDMSKWPKLKEYTDRIAARPAVKQTMKTEGLIK